MTVYERKKGALSWILTIRDGDLVYRIGVSSAGKVDLLKTATDSKLNNVEFWAAQPAPLEIPLANRYVGKAKTVLEAFNATFRANTDTYQSVFTACKPPKAGRRSKHASGCASAYASAQHKADSPCARPAGAHAA